MVLPQPVTYPVLSCNSLSLSGKQTGWICFLKVTGRSNLIRAISLLKFFGWKSLFTLISSMSKSSCSKGSFVALAFQSPRNHPYITSVKGLVGWVQRITVMYSCWNSGWVKKERAESWDIFIIWKINSGLVGQPGQYCEKKGWGRLWAAFEAHFLCFHGQKINLSFLKVL